MTAVSELISALIDAGLSAVDAAALVARAGAEMASKQPSKAAVRTRRWRENKRHKPSQTVTEPSPRENVTERHKPSQVTKRDGGIYTSSSFNLEIQKEDIKKESVNGHSTVTQSDWPSDFQEQFWRKCPRRVAKAAAMKALERVRRSGLAWEKLDAGLTRWAADAARSDPKFVKHPATWLNAGCWEDEVAPQFQSGAARSQSFMDVAQAMNDAASEGGQYVPSWMTKKGG